MIVKKTYKLILLVCCLIQNTHSYAYFYKSNSFQETNETKIVKTNDFKITQIVYDSSSIFDSIPILNNNLPSKFILIANAFKYNFNISFSRLEGYLNDPALNNNVYMVNRNTMVNMKAKNNTYSQYRDDNNIALATLTLNDDLNKNGVKTNQSFRVLITINVDGKQINFIPSVFKTNSNQLILNQVCNIKTLNKSSDESSFKSIISEEKIMSSRTKRTLSNNQAFKFYIEYLIVLDSSVYQKYNDLISNINPNLTIDCINVFFSHVVNGIDTIFQNSLTNDPNLSINIRLSNILIYTDPADTPWTNSSLSVPNITTNNGIGTVVANTCFSVFSQTMNKRNFSFTYDHAVAIMNKDIYIISGTPRSSPIGYSIVGGITGSNKYSIVEDLGIFNIPNCAHELGHNLGAPHDGSGVSLNCPASLNYIMTPVVGAYSNNLNNLFKFSNCSINTFKNMLLTPDRLNVTSIGKNLLNVPIDLKNFYLNSSLPGQLWNIDDQCRLLYGKKSNYYNCYIDNDPICAELYCNIPSSDKCTSIPGWGALPGTSCGTNKFCYQGSCVNIPNVSTLQPNPCLPNPCKNNGTCYKVSNFFLCDCPSNFTGSNCETLITTSTKSLTTTTTKLITNTTTTTSRKF